MTSKAKEDLLKGFYFNVSILLGYLIIHQLFNKFWFFAIISHTAHFDKGNILPLLVPATFGFLLSVFFLHFKQCDNMVL